MKLLLDTIASFFAARPEPFHTHLDESGGTYVCEDAGCPSHGREHLYR